MPERMVELGKDLLVRPGKPASAELHMQESFGWLCRAQDSNGDRGVAHSYVLGKGWVPSYPETTGYIIPTLLNYWKESGVDDAKRRAIEMARWELVVQLPTGAIPSLATGDPVVFDTGQVIFGWVSAFEESEDQVFREAAIRAGNWLLEVMDEDGSWREWTGSTSGITYNARTAWALALLGRCTGDERYSTAARRFLAWCLEQEVGDGWFANNCLNDNDRPLLHTIAYTARGLLESGVLLGNQDLVAASERTARSLRLQVSESGRMAGRFSRAWKPSAKWACLTGMAQICLVWSRLSVILGDTGYLGPANTVLGFLKSTQDLTSRNPGLRGGIRGSFPVNGEYCRYRIPNWATKFFMDALISASADPPRDPVYKG